MRQRCKNPRDRAYPRYGGRGIRVCERWESFAAFSVDMGPRPSSKHSLDRADNDGDYTPENCRWATAKVQNRNRGSFNRLVARRGRTQTLAAWAEELGMDYRLLAGRLRRDMSPEEAFTLAPEKGRRGAHNGRARLTADKVRAIRERCASGETQLALAREFGVAESTVGMLVRRRTWKHI